MAHSTDYSHMLLESLESGNDNNSVGNRRFSAFLKTWKLRCPCEVRTGGWTVMESEAKLCKSLEFVGQQVRVQASPEGHHTTSKWKHFASTSLCFTTWAGPLFSLHAKTSFLAGFVRFIRTQECLWGEMQHLGLHLHFEDFCNRVDFVEPKP
jgi:hypothetical protein